MLHTKANKNRQSLLGWIKRVEAISLRLASAHRLVMGRTLDRVSFSQRRARGHFEHRRGHATALESMVAYPRLEARVDGRVDADDPGLVAVKQQNRRARFTRHRVACVGQ